MNHLIIVITELLPRATFCDCSFTLQQRRTKFSSSAIFHRKVPNRSRFHNSFPFIPFLPLWTSSSHLYTSHCSLSALSPINTTLNPISPHKMCLTDVGLFWQLCILPAPCQLQLSLPSITACQGTYALNIKPCRGEESQKTMLGFEFTR